MGEPKKPIHIPSIGIGIVAIIIAPSIFWIGLVIGIIGMVFAIKARNDYRAIPGLVLNLIPIALFITWFVNSLILTIQLMS